MKGELSQEDFFFIVEQFKMSCKYTYEVMEDKKFIVEVWTAKQNSFIQLTRMYEFTPENIEVIESSERKKLLNEMLNDAVDIEDYEEAALLRDMINDI